MLRLRIGAALTLGLLIAIASFSFVSATPGAGVSGTVVARGTLEGPLHINAGDIKFQIKDDIEVVTQSVTIAPGGHTGWHSHPGPVFVTIVAGTMTFYSALDPTCSAIVYETGDSFVDRGGTSVHIARNEGLTNLVLYATYLVPVGEAFRIDQPAAESCPF